MREQRPEDAAFFAYWFNHMNRVAIGVVGQNTDALAFYRKIGFKQEGIQEQGYYCNGEYSDFVMMRTLFIITFPFLIAGMGNWCGAVMFVSLMLLI